MMKATRPGTRAPHTKGVPVDLIAYMKNVIAPCVKARIDANSDLGASLVAYALLVALIAVICIVGISVLGTSANKKFSNVGSQLG